MSNDLTTAPAWEGNSSDEETTKPHNIDNVLNEESATQIDATTPGVVDPNRITNDDGSVIETLDTALHGEPGYIKDHSPAGSNRADYYEARSEDKSDVEEETEYLKKKLSKD